MNSQTLYIIPTIIAMFFPHSAEAPKQALESPSRPQIAITEVSEPPSLTIKEIAKQKVTKEFGENQWSAFEILIQKESSWNPDAVNKTSGACGLPQALPCSKIKDKSPEGQIDWAINYIQDRYGTPAQAWGFWQGHRWY